jgi:hypothetical protein
VDVRIPNAFAGPGSARVVRALLIAALLCLATAVSGVEEGTAPPERFTAVAVRVLPDGVRSESALEIVVTRWTTREESEALARVLDEGGQEAFVKAARAKPPVGAMHEFLRRPVVARRVHPLMLAVSCAEVRCFEDGRPNPPGRRQVIILIGEEGGALSFIQFELDRQGHGKGAVVDEAVVRFHTPTGTIRLADARGSRAVLSRVRAQP